MSVPAEQMQAPPEQAPTQAPPEQAAPQQLSEDDEMDIDIAAGLGAEMMSTEQAMQMLGKALSAPKPAKMIATFFTQLMEKIQTKSFDTDLPLNPVIWLVQGGVIDELTDELQDIAQRVGTPFDPALMDQVKAEMVNILKMRSQQEQGANQQQEQAPPAQPPPSQRGLAGMV